MAVKTNCTKKGTDYYRVTLTIGRDSEGKLIRKEFYGRNKSEAEAKRDEYKNDIKNGINKTIEIQALNIVFKDWLFNVIFPSGVKTSTFETYESIYRLYIKDSGLGIKKVDAINPMMIQAFLNDLSAKKNYTLILKIFKLIKRFFNYEVDTDIILKNPCRSVKVPGQVAYLKEKNAEEIQVFSIKERDKIIKYLYKTKDRIANIVYLGFTLGMREGEILALSWNDIDMENGILHIKKSVRKTKDFNTKGEVIGRSMKLTVPKTMSSVRDIEYPDSFDDLWKKAKIQNDKDKLAAGGSYNNKNDFIFTDEEGNSISRRYVIRHWRTTLEALGIPYRTFHKTRHTFVTLMAVKNIPEIVTQTIVGHKKGSKITHEIYTHINKENIEKALEFSKIKIPK